MVFVHHTNKNGRKGPRGSGAFRGLVDTSIGFLRKGKSNGFSLSTEGRFSSDDQGPLHATLAHGDKGWSYRHASDGKQDTRTATADPAELLWRSLPDGKTSGLTYPELADRSGLSIDQVEFRLRKWRSEKRPGLGQTGRGRKGDSYRWHRLHSHS